MKQTQNIPIINISPVKGWVPLNIKELWDNRELLYFFVWRDIKVRYKQTLLGVAWTILVPLANTIVFTLLFGKLANLPTDNLPQPVFYMTGLVIWRYFATSLNSTSNSLVGGAGLLTKIYFPRLLLPLSTCVVELVDFTVAFTALTLLMLYFNTLPALTILFIPLLVLITLFTALGTGLFFAALNVKYRDVSSLVPFFIQLWMYCSVIVPFSMLPEKFGALRYLYGINPLAGIIEGFRWCLLHHVPETTIHPPWILISIGSMVALTMLFSGLYYFKRMENQFADIV
jgi:lipopolysaccharide transport system permease protein